jgi:hypothetical protein
MSAVPVELSYEETLRELAKSLPRGDRIDLHGYYQLLEWATGYTLIPIGGTLSQDAIALTIGGVTYLPLFMTRDVAENAARRCGDAFAVSIQAREILKRVPDRWGVIVDWGTDAELRLMPNHVIEFNERFRIWPVREEATESWLVEMNNSLAQAGVETAQRAAKAMEEWAARNGYPVLSGSRRARRIEHFFAVYGDGDPVGRNTRSQERWRRDYSSDPYLHHLDSVDLNARLRTILVNRIFVDRVTLPHELTDLEWQELLAHVECEYERRNVSLADAIASVDTLKSWPRLERGAQILSTYTGPRGQLFRFSKLKYLKPLIDHGELTIFPAAKYADPSLLRSQRDDELARTILADGTNAVIEHVDRKGVRRRIPGVGSVKYTMSSHTNYYAWFTTTAYDPRFFDDFDADACLIIHDANVFTNRLLRAVRDVLPLWVGAEMLVRYFDPLHGEGEVLSGFEKDFAYAYQREYRFIWDPASLDIAAVLPPLEVKLGCLRDICALIEL